MRIVLQAIMIVKVGNISYTDLGAALYRGSVRASHPTAPGFNSQRSQRFVFWSLRNFSWILMLPRFIDCLEKWTAQELNNVDGTNLVLLNSITKTFLTLISRNLAGTGIRIQLDVLCFWRGLLLALTAGPFQVASTLEDLETVTTHQQDSFPDTWDALLFWSIFAIICLTCHELQFLTSVDFEPDRM